MSETIKTREQLKQTFVTGAVPTQQDFHDLLDAMVHKNDTETTSDTDVVSPIEQFLVAYNPGYIYDGSSSRLVFNTTRMPQTLDASTPTVAQSNGTVYLERKVLYHRGRFYDLGKPGKPLDVVFSQNVSFSGENILISPNSYGSITLYLHASQQDYSDTGSEYDFCILPNTTTEIQHPENPDLHIDVETQGFTCTVRIHTTHNEYCEITAEYNDGNNATALTMLTYGDMQSADQVDDGYGADDHTEGYPFADSQVDSNKNWYIRLTDQINPMSGSMQFYQVECFYVSDPDSELQPGTYYCENQDGNSWLNEYIVEEQPEEEGEGE